MHKMRHILCNFIIRKVFKIPVGNVLTWPAQIVRFILFPSHLLLFIRDKSSPFTYDWSTDIFTVFGMKYTGDLFRVWGRYGLPNGAIFRIENRRGDTLTLSHIPSDYRAPGVLLNDKEIPDVVRISFRGMYDNQAYKATIYDISADPRNMEKDAIEYRRVYRE